MKTYYVLLLMIFSMAAQAQLKPTHIFLSTGEKMVVKGKLRRDVFIYKRYDGDKRKKIGFDEIDHVDIFETKDSITRYRRIRVQDEEKPVVVQEVKTGKVNLYMASFGVRTTMPMSSAGGFGGFGIPMTYDIENYYLRREGEKKAVHLGANKLFTNNFREAASDYFKDCPPLVEKIQQKTFKKRHLKEIVRFYNTECR